MEAITLKNTSEKLLISLDKKFFNQEQIKQVIDWLQVEFLARKVNFNESIETLGEEIHTEWWVKNKDRFADIIKEAEKLDVEEAHSIKGGKNKKEKP